MPCHLVRCRGSFTRYAWGGVCQALRPFFVSDSEQKKNPARHEVGQGSTNFFQKISIFLLCYIDRQRWAALIFLFRYCRKASKEGKTGPPITAVISASSSSYMASCVGPFAPVLSRSARISQNVAINPVRVASLFQSCFISKVFFRLYNPGSKIAVSL